VPVAAPQIVHWKERRLSNEKIELLKRTVAKGASNDEFELFIQVCQKHGLDPFTKQIYCVMFPVSKHHQDDKGIWVSGHEMVIITGIGGYRMMAARDHKDYAGSSEAEFTWFDPPRKTNATRDIPRSATVKVYRRGAPATTATVFWEEYAPADLNAPRSDFWNRMPKNQLEKCAEAKALRKAFPGLGDIFTDVELSQRLQDLTPGGREIVLADGTAPSGRPVTWEARNRAELDEHAMHGHLPGTEKARQAEEQLRKVEEEDRRLKDARNITPAAKPQPTEKPSEKGTSDAARPHLEAEAVGPDEFIIRGDIEGTLPMIEYHCYRKRDWWRCNLENLQKMQGLQEKFAFKLTVLPAPSPSGAKGAPATKATKPPAGTGRSQAGPPAEPEVLVATIESHTEKMTAKKQPMMSVLLKTAEGKVWFSVFDNDLFPFISKAKGRQGEFIVKRGNYPSIVGFVKLAGREFTDGKVPVIQRDREAGTPGLFK
jgi:phage recombination protein Bet